MTALTLEQLAEIRKRAEAASPGPWEWSGNELSNAAYNSVIEPTVECMAYCYGGSPRLGLSEGNRAFIAAARADVPLLLAEVDRLRTEAAGHNAVPNLLTAMLRLTDEQRLEVMRNFCRACGDMDPSCQCDNDD